MGCLLESERLVQRFRGRKSVAATDRQVRLTFDHILDFQRVEHSNVAPPHAN
jgi:hypothetical protein